MSPSKRRIETPFSRISALGAGRRGESSASRLLVRGSDRVEAYSRGGQLLPSLLSGPTATPGTTACNIAWAVDLASYHRVKYKKSGDPSYTESSWSSSAGLKASIGLSGLSEASTYLYQIMSDLNKLGLTRGYWTNGGADFQ